MPMARGGARQWRPSGSRRELSIAAASAAYDGMMSEVRTMNDRLHAYGKEFGFDKSWSKGDGDAFRHAAASALTTCDRGVGAAVVLGVGYEMRNFAQWVKEKYERRNDPAQSIGSVVDGYLGLVQESAMDIHNDVKGIQLGLCRDQLSERDIVTRIAKDTKERRMLVIKDGTLSRSGTDKADAPGPPARERRDTKGPSEPSGGRGSRPQSGGASPGARQDRRNNHGATGLAHGPGEMSA